MKKFILMAIIIFVLASFSYLAAAQDISTITYDANAIKESASGQWVPFFITIAAIIVSVFIVLLLLWPTVNFLRNQKTNTR